MPEQKLNAVKIEPVSLGAEEDRSEPAHRTSLSRRDLIIFEKRLCEAVRTLFPFKGHSVLFPRHEASLEARWESDEKKVLLPLSAKQDEVLGVFVARGVNAAAVKPLLSRWPALGGMIVENLLFYKRSLCDAVTGLFTRHYLLQKLEREMDVLREPFRPAGGGAEGDFQRPGNLVNLGRDGLLSMGGETTARHSLGILVVRLSALRDIVREYGYQFADSIMQSLADAVTGACPEQTLAARTGDSEFAVLVPAATPKACKKLAESLDAALKAVHVEHPLARERVAVTPAIGYAMYPQDMAGNLFMRPVAEQAQLLLRKARLAAALAREGQFGLQSSGHIMGFGRILAEGGRVQEILPLSRVIVSLGASVHAREGQRFSCWSTQYPVTGADDGKAAGQRTMTPLYKGELVLIEVGENSSQAEIIHLGDPTWSLEPGDHLVLLPEEQGRAARSAAGGEGVKLEPETGLLRHGDFLAAWAEAREKADTFTLALMRFAARPQEDEGGSRNVSQYMGEAARICCEELGLPAAFADIPPGKKTILGGRYGLASLIFYHPGLKPDEAKARYEALSEVLSKRAGLDVAIGLSFHPALEYRKADSLENAHKALEYAILLPEPHVGVLDTLALNISADKLFSMGDTFAAIKEYQQALLFDNDNALAWNSLGICLAGLGRHTEALRHFKEALRCNSRDVMALYNAGYVHQSLSEPKEARKYYKQCLKYAPEHIFSLLRMGQLAESEGKAGSLENAWKFYEQAAALPDGKDLTRRHMARLCLKQGDEESIDRAREHLHEALLHDPQDALAMQLLARIYLDAGEDPEIAASLARQSVALRPGLKSSWLELARALDMLGQSKQAKEARLRAGE